MIVLADQSETAAEALGGLTYVGYAAKEVLHYDILAAMQRAAFLDGLVFHGGTALRLCYGAARLQHQIPLRRGTNVKYRAGALGNQPRETGIDC